MKKNREKALFYGAVIFLFLYTFRNVNQGIDVTDTGYHFSNFRYMSGMDPMWIFSTYLASALGHFFTLLPGGTTLLGMNVYTSLVPALLGVMSFVFCRKVLKYRFVDSFGGVLTALALCWCPTTCVYNYLTYFFFCAGAVCLYIGLARKKELYLSVAGVFLGMNVLVRFPNAAEAALILAVWFTCFLRKEAFGQYVRKTWKCLAGYLLGMGIVLLQIQIQYGLDEYIAGIIRMFGITADASDYTLYAMLYNLLQAYVFSGRWVLIMAVCVALGVLGFMAFHGRFVRAKCIGYAVCCVVLMRWFYGQGMFSLAYDGYGAILNWGAVALIGALLIAVWEIFSKRTSEQEKIFAAIVVIVIGITPLGSNNQMYANINNMFLIVPYVLHAVSRMKAAEKKAFAWPLYIMSMTCVIMLIWQSLCFGNVFIFRDAVPRDSEVTSVEAVAHMKTNAENAEKLEELGWYVEQAGLKGRPVLLFGDVPALSAYLEMPFVMSPWPDLPSYSNEVFAEELGKVLENIEQSRPVLIFGADFYDFLTRQAEDIGKFDAYEGKYGFKISLLRDMIEQYSYTCTFKNAAYAVWE